MSRADSFDATATWFRPQAIERIDWFWIQSAGKMCLKGEEVRAGCLIQSPGHHEIP